MTHKLSRRQMLKASATGVFAGLAMKTSSVFGQDAVSPAIQRKPSDPVEYIVVGSGAGGGPLACNLAKAGHKVVLVEAGANDANNITEVPLFVLFTQQDERISWDFFVRHYSDNQQQQRDSKFVEEKQGILYPRSSTLGGCTEHSFMIELTGSNSDWQYIADLFNDPSWRPEKMRAYYQRFERNRHAPQPPKNPARHGYAGYLPTEVPQLELFDNDPLAQRLFRSAVQQAQEAGLEPSGKAAEDDIMEKLRDEDLDPNDYRLDPDREGVYNLPLYTFKGRRRSPRELILATRQELPNNLILQTNTLATRVLFEGDPPTAVGIEYMEGAHLYRASKDPKGGPAPRRKSMRATREVIIAGGAFNSPQLLKLSGIGPKAELQKFGIKTIVNLPGVGENLQDRYELGINSEYKLNFNYAQVPEGFCTFSGPFGDPNDPCYKAWLQGKGPYTMIGVPVIVFLKSEAAKQFKRPDPDLVILFGAFQFTGYYPGYVLDDLSFPNRGGWLVLKAHTQNRGGTVKLRSADPRDTPLINFRYFEEGTDKNNEDLQALVEGLDFVQKMNAQPIAAEVSNGALYGDVRRPFELTPDKQMKSRKFLTNYARNEAWGHHASCTNKMGLASDPMAVVDNNFKVHGTRNLRVVDASVFPRIPGYFILTPIYQISEKASDVIIEDAKNTMVASAPEPARLTRRALLTGANA